MSLQKCQTEGCDGQGCVTLEIIQAPLYEADANRFKVVCCECATSISDEVQKEHGLAKWREVVPVVGLPATIGSGSDSYPAKVTEVSASGKRIKVQRLCYHAGEGHDYFGTQVWVVTDEPEGDERVYTLRKNGRWIQQGDSINGQGIGLGFARAHQNPSF